MKLENTNMAFFTTKGDGIKQLDTTGSLDYIQLDLSNYYGGPSVTLASLGYPNGTIIFDPTTGISYVVIDQTKTIGSGGNITSDASITSSGGFIANTDILPAGTNDYTLRYDGLDWADTAALQVATGATGTVTAAGILDVSDVINANKTSGTGLAVDANATIGGTLDVTGTITVSTGNITTTLGNITAATTVTGETGLVATTCGVTAVAGDVLACAGNIVATLGNITSSAGAVSASTTVTAGAGLIATTCGLTVTAGASDINDSVNICGTLTLDGSGANVLTLGGTTNDITFSGSGQKQITGLSCFTYPENTNTSYAANIYYVNSAISELTSGVGWRGMAVLITDTLSLHDLSGNVHTFAASDNINGAVGSLEIADYWFFENDDDVIRPTFSGDTHSSTTVDGIADTSTLTDGWYISGAGIPPSTTFTIASSTSITLSNAATATATGVIFTPYDASQISVDINRNSGHIHTIISGRVQIILGDRILFTAGIDGYFLIDTGYIVSTASNAVNRDTFGVLYDLIQPTHIAERNAIYLADSSNNWIRIGEFAASAISDGTIQGTIPIWNNTDNTWQELNDSSKYFVASTLTSPVDIVQLSTSTGDTMALISDYGVLLGKGIGDPNPAVLVGLFPDYIDGLALTANAFTNYSNILLEASGNGVSVPAISVVAKGTGSIFINNSSTGNVTLSSTGDGNVTVSANSGTAELSSANNVIINSGTTTAITSTTTATITGTSGASLIASTNNVSITASDSVGDIVITAGSAGDLTLTAAANKTALTNAPDGSFGLAVATVGYIKDSEILRTKNTNVAPSTSLTLASTTKVAEFIVAVEGLNGNAGFNYGSKLMLASTGASTADPTEYAVVGLLTGVLITATSNGSSLVQITVTNNTSDAVAITIKSIPMTDI